jgi:CBS domain containing-hemolysin-like protein
MASESWTEVWIATGALLLMGLAAGLEAAVGLVGREGLRSLADGPGGRRRTLDDLVRPRRALTVGLVTVQVLSLVVATALLTTTLERELGWGEHLLAIAIAVAAYVVLGLALPDALRSYRRDETPAAIAWLAGGLDTLVRPLTALGARLGRFLGRLLPAPSGPPAFVGYEDELAPLIGVEATAGPIEPTERAMIQGVLDLEDLSVREIMVPRVDMVAVEIDTPLDDLVATIVGAGHSRIPVYRESIDQIVGVLYVKDLIPYVPKEPGAMPLVELLRPPLVVPESKRIDVLLREMRRTRTHIAIVADEYGGTAGLVTIEDVLEEIVGEIQDEYDVEVPLLERTDERTVVADARLPLAEIEEAVGIRFPDDADYESLGGYVQTTLGRLPREGDRFADPVVGLEVDILKVEGHRIGRVRLTTLHATSLDDDEPAEPDETVTSRVREGEPDADVPESEQPTESLFPSPRAEVDRV